MQVALYAAVADGNVIGRDNGMPWKLSADLRRFKADTMGKPVVMGRRTFESMGKPLAGRFNIVVTRDRDRRIEGVEAVHSLDDALALARIRCMGVASEICVIGGGQIYGQAMPTADRLHITHVLATVEGDTRFPPIDPAIWCAAAETPVPAGPKDEFPTRHVAYRRVTPLGG